MDFIFDAVRGRAAGDILALSHDLCLELFTLALHASQAYTDLRVTPSRYVYATDASLKTVACCRAAVSATLSAELLRHALSRGTWTRLLSPSAAWLRWHDLLDGTDELPAADPVVETPLWNDVVETLPFELVTVCGAAHGTHVNVLEVDAALMAERAEARLGGDSSFCVAYDSQVGLGCLAKGRSASPKLNAKLQQSLPVVLGSGLYDRGAFVPSACNVADDPTRDRPVRGPARACPRWLADAWHGHFTELDRLVAIADELGDQRRRPLPDFADYICRRLDIVEQLTKTPGGDTTVEFDAPQYLRGLKRPDLDAVDAEAADRVRSLPTSSCGTICHAGALAAPSAPADGFRLLSGGSVKILASLPRGWFFLRPDLQRDPAWRPSRPGALHLFADSTRMVQKLLQQGAPWVLAVGSQDLAVDETGDSTIWPRLVELLRDGAFAAWQATPPCRSFSMAVRPPVRSFDLPRGLTGLGAARDAGLARDNAMADRLADFMHVAVSAGYPFWVAHPAQSMLWQWSLVPDGMAQRCTGWYCDLCRFGARWKKPTLVLSTFTDLKGHDARCRCLRQHFQLRGRDGKGFTRTALARDYPHKLCEFLTSHVAVAAKWRRGQPLPVPAGPYH